MNVTYRSKFLTILAAFACLALSSHAFAAEGEAWNDDIEYAEPSMYNISRMYWKLDKFDLTDDNAVDNFMRINECSVYKDYYHNEFEWRDIREASRDYLEKHKDGFPVRLEFVQPLSLGAYDFERKGFEVIEKHKIKGLSRFEVYSDDPYSEICGELKEINGYPRALLLELSRPLEFDFIPMEEKKAQALVNRKIKKFKELKEKQQNKENLYSFRESILVIKIKLFSIKLEDVKSDTGLHRSEVLAVLEGVEVYSDRDREDLIFEETFRREKATSAFEQRLKEKFEKSRREKERESIINGEVIDKIESDSEAASEAYKDVYR